jgi:hypothetical protein
MLALEHHEESGLGAKPGSFEFVIPAKSEGEDVGQRQGSLPVTLARDPDLAVAEHDISKAEQQHLA